MSADDGVVVVGGGLSGLATALGAALLGRRVTVFEAADQVGGASAYSGGQVWVGANHVAAGEGVADDQDRTERYVRALGAAHPELLDEAALRRWVVTAPVAMRYWEDVGAVRWVLIRGLADYRSDLDGALASGRYLTAAPVPASRLNEWQGRLRVSPYFRMGTTYEDVFAAGRRRLAQGDDADELTFGTGLVAGFLARVLEEPRVELVVSARVRELLRDDDGRVVGARADGPGGPIERYGSVVLATSTFDWDPALVEEFLGLDQESFGSMAPDSLRGDAVKLARSVGGAIARIPATSVPLVPGWRSPTSPTGTGFANGPEYALPHAMIVDRTGRRFCNDSHWVDIVGTALAPGAQHLPMFLVFDEQHHRTYGLGDTPPGGAYPDGVVTTAPTLPALGTALGIDGRQLEATAARFSAYAAKGEDPDFGRGTVEFVNRFSGDPDHHPSPVLGPIDQPPFYGLRLLLLGTGIGSSGVHIDADGRVLDPAGAAVPGLYAVGSCAATTTFGSAYNSGMALSRGLTLAYLVAHDLAGEVHIPASGSGVHRRGADS